MSNMRIRRTEPRVSNFVCGLQCALRTPKKTYFFLTQLRSENSPPQNFFQKSELTALKTFQKLVLNFSTSELLLNFSNSLIFLCFRSKKQKVYRVNTGTRLVNGGTQERLSNVAGIP